MIAALSLYTLALFASDARAEQPCSTFYAPAEIVESAMLLTGARMAGADEDPARRTLLNHLACASEPLAPGDAAAVHVALRGERPVALPPPLPEDALDGPPHPEGGVALVDGVAFAALPGGRPALVQAFDAEGKVVYTRWLEADAVNAVRGGEKLPTAPTLPKMAPVPLRGGEILRLVVSSAFVVTGSALFVVAAESRADWYDIKDSPVDTVEALEQLRVRTNVSQGAGLAFAGVGAAGLLSVAVRVPF
jgi:hypothetical protein